jgi:hypothetical protein
MFQLFHIDVAKVDRDVAYVAMVVYVCCKRLSPMFHPFSVHLCSKCFRRMSQVFHLSSFVCCKCLHLDVLKVYRDIAHVAMVF